MAHKPTDKSRKRVRQHAAVGTPQRTIADCLGIHVQTLREHYRKELDLSIADANADMVGQLYQQGMAGNTAAILFWLKTRAGFKETSVVDNKSSDGTMTPKGILPANLDMSKLSDAALKEIMDLAAAAEAAANETPDDAPTKH